MALADWNQDGRPDLMVTRINERVLALANRGEGQSVAVSLKGAPGNPDAVGARITARFSDGSVQASEVYAGSGYLSQAEPLAFFGYRFDNPPIGFEVTWPNGERTEHPFAVGLPRFVITR